MALLSLFRLGVNVTTGKILAMYVGASGLFFYGQLQSLILLIQNLSTGATHNGIIRFWSKKDETNPQTLVSTSASIYLLCSSLISVLLIGGGAFFSRLFFETDAYQLIIRLVGVSVFSIGFIQLLLAYLNAELRYSHVALVNNVQTFFLLFLVVAGVFYKGVNGALAGLALSSIPSAILIGFLFHKTVSRLVVKPFLSWNKLILKKLGRFSLMALSSAAIVSVFQIAVRNYLTQMNGSQVAGWWEAANRISNIYLFFLSFLFTGYFLPRFSRYIQSHEIVSELKKGALYLIGLFALVAAVLLPLGSFWLQLIFSDEFLVLSSFLVFQVLGDFLKSCFWLFSNYLAALNQALTFVIFEAIAHGLIYLLMVFAFGHLGLKGFFYAYVSGHLILLALVAIYFKFAIIKNKA